MDLLILALMLIPILFVDGLWTLPLIGSAMSVCLLIILKEWRK